ncbi:MAG: type III-B CRISPR module RAMP protein Cmr6 [Peptococcaceae bacterium]
MKQKRVKEPSPDTPIDIFKTYELTSADDGSLKMPAPQELQNYIEVIKKYCETMMLDLISEKMDMQIADKLIVSLGNPDVLETSITLHHVYGVPYLPGQALKGVFRKYFTDEIIESDEKEFVLCNGQSVNKKRLYKQLFGENYQAGKGEAGEQGKSGIIFFDSFPDNGFKLERDIISTHYKKYYDGGGELPDGVEEPNLVSFYVVKNADFKIFCALDQDKFGADCSLALQWDIVNKVVSALEEYGVGAKTSTGYGYLKLKSKNELNEEYEEKERKIKNGKLALMSKVERKIYDVEHAKSGEKTELIATLVKSLKNADDLSNEEKKELAEYAQKFYKQEKKWKIKKEKKTNNIIKIICEILECDLP